MKHRSLLQRITTAGLLLCTSASLWRIGLTPARADEADDYDRRGRFPADVEYCDRDEADCRFNPREDRDWRESRDRWYRRHPRRSRWLRRQELPAGTYIPTRVSRRGRVVLRRQQRYPMALLVAKSIPNRWGYWA